MGHYHKAQGNRTFKARVCPRGSNWRRYSQQLQLRYVSEEDNEPGEDLKCFLNSRVPSTENTMDVMHGTGSALDQTLESVTAKHDSHSL